jgi:hypothetical protein
MDLFRHQMDLRVRGFTLTSEDEMDLPGFHQRVVETFFNEQALPPVPDAYGPVATRYRNKAVIHYRWTNNALELKEISDARYATIGTGEQTRQVPWFRWLSLDGAEHFTRCLLGMVPPEDRHAEGAFGLHCFRSFAQVVGGPHADGFEYGGTYVADRTTAGGVSYLINIYGKQVLDYQLQPGEILLFHERNAGGPPLFTHGATGLEGEGRRDAMVIQFEAPEDTQATEAEKRDLGGVW